MIERFTRKRLLLPFAPAALVIVAVLASACGDDGGKNPDPLLEHAEFLLASTEEGGGRLTGQFEFDRPIGLFFNTCLGGTGEHCEGGTAVYSSVSPGFEPLEEDDAQQSLYTLADGTEITLEVTAIDEELSLRIEDTVLDDAGDSVVLGETPEIHADVTSQLALPGGPPSGEYEVSFRLHTTSETYDDSQEFTLSFVPLEAEGDDHEHEE